MRTGASCAITGATAMKPNSNANHLAMRIVLSSG
jgi:hypothetical protein